MTKDFVHFVEIWGVFSITTLIVFVSLGIFIILFSPMEAFELDLFLVMSVSLLSGTLVALIKHTLNQKKGETR